MFYKLVTGSGRTRPEESFATKCVLHTLVGSCQQVGLSETPGIVHHEVVSNVVFLCAFGFGIFGQGRLWIGIRRPNEIQKWSRRGWACGPHVHGYSHARPQDLQRRRKGDEVHSVSKAKLNKNVPKGDGHVDRKCTGIPMHARKGRKD